MNKKIKLLLISSEMTPFAQTGGLAEAIAGLSKALKKFDLDIRVALPFYRSIKKMHLNFNTIAKQIKIPMGPSTLKGDIILFKTDENIPIYFIKRDRFFDRSGIYGDRRGDYHDNAERFIFLSKVIFKLCQIISFIPDVLHCHDWQIGLIPVYHKEPSIYNINYFSNTVSIFTIHNIAYQGIFKKDKFIFTDLPEDIFSQNGLEFWGKINFMKGGILFSDIVSTVSPTYAKEIQTKEYGFGLEELIKSRASELCGILNGVDYSNWDPKNDPFLASNYSSKDLRGKEICKKDLINEMELNKEMINQPLVGMISRLASQKGIDILLKALPGLIKMGANFVFLGKGEKGYQRDLKMIAKRYPGRIGLRFSYDPTLAHKIEAGSDILVMPSLYEPCGLAQIYAMRYGTIPVVRAVGGLEDTVENYIPQKGKGTGFKFKEYNAKAFLSKLKEAIVLFKNKEEWQNLMMKAMEVDFSWEKSASKYIELYSRGIDKKRK